MRTILGLFPFHLHFSLSVLQVSPEGCSQQVPAHSVPRFRSAAAPVTKNKTHSAPQELSHSGLSGPRKCGQWGTRNPASAGGSQGETRQPIPRKVIVPRGTTEKPLEAGSSMGAGLLAGSARSRVVSVCSPAEEMLRETECRELEDG